MRKDNLLFDNLIQLLAGLPGLGPRSARRAALYLLTRRETHMLPLSGALKDVAENVHTCRYCGNLDMQSPCCICSDTKRDNATICVVARISDLWAIERTGSFNGLYHVLGGVLSALDGIGPEDLDISGLSRRVEENRIKELILALSATVEGQSTAHYMTDHFQGKDIKITKLAHGVPVGGELDYLDDGTITTALHSRAAM
jgi:recombination protein RecR